MLLGSGVKPEHLSSGQAAIRAILVYLVVLGIVRFGKKRMMARATAFDVVVVIVIGSIAGRAITGNAQLMPAMAGVAVVVVMHWIISALAVRSRFVGSLAKGRSAVLIRDGKLDEDMLRREHMTPADLDEDLRQKGHGSYADIKDGRLERSGQLSLVEAPKALEVVEVRVEDGVQTVRVEIS